MVLCGPKKRFLWDHCAKRFFFFKSVAWSLDFHSPWTIQCDKWTIQRDKCNVDVKIMKGAKN